MQEIRTIDAYIAQFPEETQAICQRIRQTIRAAAPNAKEKISYGLATFYDGENLIHFGVMKNHIGIYPGADGVAAFSEKLTDYPTSKGAIQLPKSEPFPYDLVSELTAYRVREAQARRKR